MMVLLKIRMEKTTIEASYQEIMDKIDTLMAKESGNPSKEELAEIHAPASTAQEHEQEK